MNQAQRILRLLTLLRESDQLCTKKIVEIFETDKRTVQRDIKILKEFLGEKLLMPSRGCYALQNRQELFSYLKDSVKIREFFEFIALFDARLLSIFDVREFPIIQQVKKDVATLYHIAENPIERLDDEKLNPIKEAIKAHRKATIRYIDRDTKIKHFRSIKPIKIIFAEGNWYLGAMTEEEQNGGFKFLRINFIQSFELEPETFHREIDAEEFIRRFQSLFQNYQASDIEVTLEIDSFVARYFRVKNHLKSQQITQEKEDGTLIATYTITNEMEILPLVKKWLPHIRILKPKWLQDRLKEDLRTYLSKD